VDLSNPLEIIISDRAPSCSIDNVAGSALELSWAKA